MENYIGYAVASLLLVSAVLLATLIPGGPIENRDFSHISPLKLVAFNVFLTVLGIGSLALVYFTAGGFSIAFIAAALCGVSYFLVYALDLGKIFPVSSVKMPPALFRIELVGLILSIPLTLLSIIYLFVPNGSGNVTGVQSSAVMIALVFIIALGIGIVLFSTKSAMRRSPNNTHSSDAKIPRD